MSLLYWESVELDEKALCLVPKKGTPLTILLMLLLLLCKVLLQYLRCRQYS